MNKISQFRNLRNVFILLMFIASVFSFREVDKNYRTKIDLSGFWQFTIDSADIGIKQNWFSKQLTDSVKLPGTTDLNQKGYKNINKNTMHLNRVYTYEGPAWYKKEINIPQNWKDRHIVLIMERTKPSKIWIDSQLIGESILLESPQNYDLTKFLTPGKHTMTIRIDNRVKLTPYGNVHIYAEDTQTNWNGIIGNFYIEASDKNYINDLKVFPDIEGRKIKVLLAVQNPRKLDKVNVELNITKEINGKITKLKPARYEVRFDSVLQLEYLLGDKMDLWDEYSTPVYKLNAVVSCQGQFIDNMVVPFGMRKFAVSGSHFTINGRVLFLRGKHDGCVFPLTGFPPMDSAAWMRVFRIAKSYGINHYRFHSWCPPRAAFEAADVIGIYLQPELPFWGGLESDTTAVQLTDEGLALLKSYANHPSFVMMGPGNEIWSGHDRVKKIINILRNADNRPLYTLGSNNNIGYLGAMPEEDFHIAARTPFDHDTILTHTRLTHAFADSKDGGILNTELPSTMINFNYAVSQIQIPLISHEVGQYQVFPDYDEIKKYTGVLKAWNLEVFRNRLEKAGMSDQNKAFRKASGALSALCYRAEIEAAFRTKGLAGFQLLDLQDYPGQGTALVGILDAFMDSKNVITREEWTQFCNDVVPLLLFEKYCYTTKEKFTAEVQVANYSNKNLKNKMIWNITDENKNVIIKGEFSNTVIPCGGLFTIGKIDIPLSTMKAPAKLTVNLLIANTKYRNSWSIWVYPSTGELKTAENVTVSMELTGELISSLKKGDNVLLFPSSESVKNNSVAGLFPSEFWNYGMFKGISEWVKKPVSPGTMGILTDPRHPVFKGFPTDFYTNWQWWSIVKNSNPLILNLTDNGYRPIVQVIDNLERNNKLGLIFEFRVGKGKLLVCMARLNNITDKPEAKQLYNSIINYMNSDKFNPDYEADEELLKKLFQ